MKIRFRFLAGLFVLLAFMSSIYAYFLHDAHRTEYLAGVDRTLATAVNMAREILPPDYHDRISDKKSVSPQDRRAGVEGAYSEKDLGTIWCHK